MAERRVRVPFPSTVIKSLFTHCCVFLLLMSEPVRNVLMRNQTLTMFSINPLVHIYQENDRRTNRRTNLQASLHSQRRASCSKSAAGLLPCCHQADIRMRSHRLLRLDDNKSTAVSLFSRLCIHKLHASCFSNFLQICEYHVATRLNCSLMKSTKLLQIVDKLAASW